MPLIQLKRETSKPIEARNPESTGGFYNPLKKRLSEPDKRLLRHLRNLIPHSETIGRKSTERS